MRMVNDFLIFEMPTNDMIDLDQVEQISLYTHNTWEPDRPLEEIRKNTLQGKKAEYVIECYLAENSSYRYKSYDDIRTDSFKKHAPFDGILYNANINSHQLDECIFKINEEINSSDNDTGHITDVTRRNLEDNGIYTVEIKSSLLQDPRDYSRMNNKLPSERTDDDYRLLCEYIKGFYDYFVYPPYTRTSSTINNFYSYCQYVFNNNSSIFGNLSDSGKITTLLNTAFDNACDIYTRVFIDTLSNELILPGYIIKTRFYEEPRIQKMPSPKSRLAIYYMYHMRYGNPFSQINNDAELQNWNIETEKSLLLNTSIQQCPNCGEVLRFVHSQKHGKYLYVCDNCPPKQKWYEMSKIHTKNIK